MSYDNHARKQNAEYDAAYGDWLASMTPSERRNLKAMGLHKALSPHAQSGAVESQRVDIFQEGAGFDDEGAEIDPNVTAEESAPDAPEDGADAMEDAEAGFRLKMGVILRKLVGELLSARNRALAVECLSLATGIAYDGVSQTEIAARFGITKAAVSRRCVELCDRLEIEPPRGMRQEAAAAEAAGENTEYDVDMRTEPCATRAE